MKLKQKHQYLDIVTAVVLSAISIYIITESCWIIKDSKVKLYTSPGLMPLILGIFLLLCSLILLKRNIEKLVLKKILSNFKLLFESFIRDSNTINILKGIIFLAIYVFLLVPNFRFWLASLIFLISIMSIFRATSLVRICIISILSVVSINVLFQVIFHVPLP